MKRTATIDAELTAAPNLKLTLTPKQSARETGLPERLTYAVLESGELPAIRVGNRWHIPRSALNKFIERRAARETRTRARKARMGKQEEVAV